MNADVTPMNADEIVFIGGGEYDGSRGDTTMQSIMHLSAFIGVTSAFIGVSKDFRPHHSTAFIGVSKDFRPHNSQPPCVNTTT
jgi:hypothetical protein